MHEGPPVTQWLLRCTGGLHRIRSPDGRGAASGQRAYSDRPVEHALNPETHVPGSTHVRTPHPRPSPPGRPAPGRRDRRGPLGGLQLRPGPRRAPVVRQLARRRRRHRARSRRRHGRVPAAVAPVRTGCGTPAHRGAGTGSRPSAQNRNRLSARRTSQRGNYTGRLTGFRARLRRFSANFQRPDRATQHHPPPAVRPARTGATGPGAPYVDWPLRQGALPRTAHECNAS